MHGATDGVWAEDARLPREILDSLRGLNLRFLELVRAGSGCRRLAAAALDQVQVESLARCPYALFDLKFDDATHWQLRLEGCRQWQVADDARTDARIVEFTRLALFFAWHAVRVHAASAQLTLGMTPAGVQAFRAVGLEKLSGLAPAASLQLAPRWQDSGTFWGALLKAAAGRDSARLERIQLYGVQLAAAGRQVHAPPV